MMDLEFIERRKKYILACIEEPNDYHRLNCLYHMVKIWWRIMWNLIWNIYHFMIGRTIIRLVWTLWLVLQRTDKEPSIVDNFTNYFIVSLKLDLVLRGTKLYHIYLPANINSNLSTNACGASSVTIKILKVIWEKGLK